MSVNGPKPRVQRLGQRLVVAVPDNDTDQVVAFIEVFPDPCARVEALGDQGLLTTCPGSARNAGRAPRIGSRPAAGCRLTSAAGGPAPGSGCPPGAARGCRGR